MQPLMYQFTQCTCWYASMINGIMLLRHKRIGDPWNSLVLPMEDRLLRSLTAQYTEFSASAWRRKDEYEYYISVMGCLGRIANFEVRVLRNENVEDEIRKLNFIREVAVCNTSNGEHSILLHGRMSSGRDRGRIKCFDPCWTDVIRRERNENYSIIPGDPQTNLRVTYDHLLSNEDDRFTMGEKHRFLTILTIPDR